MINKFSAIVKATTGAITRITNGTNNAGKDAHQAFGLTPDMTGILNFYFPAIDFDNLNNLSPDDIGQLRDVVEQFGWFEENLEAIEELMLSYMRQQIAFNAFKARIVKAGFKGAEKIEKSVLDIFLAHKGYTSNRSLLGRQSDNAVLLMNKELENALNIEDANLQTSLIMAALRRERTLKEIADKPQRQAELEEANALTRYERELIKNKIKYGSQAAAKTVVRF